MIKISLASLLPFALLAGACAHQESPPPVSQSTASSDLAPAEPATAAPPSAPKAELTPAAGTVPAPNNALGVPETPPAASEGPAGASPGTAEPARTPDVVYVPTPQPVVDRMLEMAKVKKSDVVYDLGCGDGRIVVTAAKRYGARAYGFDIDPDRVAEARANVAAAKVEHLVTIEQRDIFTLDLSPASVVTLYLLPTLNVKLIPQLQKLKPGSRIVSHDFPMEGVKPLQHVTIPAQGDSSEHAIYLWHAPIKRP